MGPLRKSISPELTSGVWAATVISYELFQKTQIANSNNLSAAGLVFICASQCTLQLILTNLCLPRARSPRGGKARLGSLTAPLPRGQRASSLGRHARRPKSSSRSQGQQPFFEKREAKVVQRWLRSWRGSLTLDMFSQRELRHLTQFPIPKT